MSEAKEAGVGDDLGDRMKLLEMAEAGRKAMPGLPVMARLDGRAFHAYTRGMQRPFDAGMLACMRETMRALVEEFHAALGYTQSDEITLVWREPDLFDGRWQKLTSVLAGYASATFVRIADRVFPEKHRHTPCFDCRVWQVPNAATAIDVFAWREHDAVKNSVQMAAQSVCSHRELHGQGRADQMEMLHARGINWNDYPVHFKRGIYAQRQTVQRALTDEELTAIPEAHRPPADQAFTRGFIAVLDLPPIRQVPNPEELLIGRQEER